MTAGGWFIGRGSHRIASFDETHVLETDAHAVMITSCEGIHNKQITPDRIVRHLPCHLVPAVVPHFAAEHVSTF